MLTKILAAAALISLTGCIATPRIELTETINFDYVVPDVAPMSYADLLCCYDCVV